MRFDELPLIGEYDVVVAGGGTAGFAAAAAAAERGMRTLVLEQRACLGGTSTGGMTSQFMGFSADGAADRARGIFGEVLRRLVALGASNGVGTIRLNGLRDMEVPAAAYDSEALKVVMDRIAAERGVTVLFHTRAVSLSMREDEIDDLVVHNLEGLRRVKARVYIDASFHGSVAAEAGCPWELGEDGATQPATLICKIAGVDFDRFAKTPEDVLRQIVQEGIASGKMFYQGTIARLLPGGLVFSGMSRVPTNPADVRSVSEAERVGREQVRTLSDYFRARIPGFENARMAAAAEFLGLRDARRIVGQYRLTADDIANGAAFDDAVASSSYPIDMHVAGNTASILVKPKNGVYQIPFRCLVGAVRNLVVAGRCISADAYAHAGIRVMVTCMRTGEAAGVAAAASVHRNEDVNALNGATLDI